MIRRSNQNWEIGSKVNVGFLKGLTVKAAKAVKDWLPDIYLLERNGTYYEFIPHNGLSKISAEAVARDWGY